MLSLSACYLPPTVYSSGKWPSHIAASCKFCKIALHGMFEPCVQSLKTVRTWSFMYLVPNHFDPIKPAINLLSLSLNNFVDSCVQMDGTTVFA